MLHRRVGRYGSHLDANFENRDHSGYKVLCDQCEYISNQLGNLKNVMIEQNTLKILPQNIYICKMY